MQTNRIVHTMTLLYQIQSGLVMCLMGDDKNVLSLSLKLYINEEKNT